MVLGTMHQRRDGQGSSGPTAARAGQAAFRLGGGGRSTTRQGVAKAFSQARPSPPVPDAGRAKRGKCLKHINAAKAMTYDSNSKVATTRSKASIQKAEVTASEPCPICPIAPHFSD